MAVQVQGYVTALREKGEAIGGSADKLRNGLSKLMEARTQVEEMSIVLEKNQVMDGCDYILDWKNVG